MKSYRGNHTPHGLVVLRENDAPLAKRYDLHKFEPASFESPDQLALAILADYFENDRRALEYYQAFRDEVVDMLPEEENWELTWSDIARAIMAIDRKKKHP